MDVEESSGDEGSQIIREIIEHGMKTGITDDPILTKRFMDYMKTDSSKPEKSKKSKRFGLRKKDKKAKATKARVRNADSGTSETESSETETPLMTNVNSKLAPDTISSKKVKSPYDDGDTPIYEEEMASVSGEGETSDERDLLQRMKTLNVQNHEREEDALIREGLEEIRQELDSGAIPHDRFANLAWRSLFFSTNTTEVLTEGVLSDFLDQYVKM